MAHITFTPVPRVRLQWLKKKQENESNYKPKRGKKWVFMNTYSPPRFCLLWFRPSYSFPRSWKNHFKIARTSVSKLLTFKVTCLYQDLSVLFLPLSPAKFWETCLLLDLDNSVDLGGPRSQSSNSLHWGEKNQMYSPNIQLLRRKQYSDSNIRIANKQRGNNNQQVRRLATEKCCLHFIRKRSATQK